MRRGSALLLVAVVALGCGKRRPIPLGPIAPTLLGRCQGAVDRARLCGDWAEAVDSCEGDATVHDSLPELDEGACYVEVDHRGSPARPLAVAAGCGYPRSPPAIVKRLLGQAGRYRRVAAGAHDDLPAVLRCELPDADRRVAAAHNARTLTRLATRLAAPQPRYAYGAIGTFGFGSGEMGVSPLVPWRPGDTCLPLAKREVDRLGVNVLRAGRAASAYHGRVAPVITVSGGAVHAPLYEAFMLLHLLHCRFDVPDDAVLLDPCADHTHTNVRNTGSLVIELGARTAYLVTDDGLQAGYLQEHTGFGVIGGNVDQRALRDWGYLVGAWRQASRGIDAGFWFTPYRFWGEPHEALGGASCVE
ncbi:MAG: YdcF family protein [Myxococcales bacterium]|nr:YdcF family protein [Myxococcales bacterium]